MVQELTIYLQNRDMQANKQLEQIQYHLDDNMDFKEQLDKVESCVDNLDFPGAVILVKQLSQMLQGRLPS
jgi:hypothetical protein